MPRGSKAEQAAKRRTVAKGVVAGKKTAKIAREAKCSDRHVRRLAAAEPTRFLIAEMMRPHRSQLEKLATKVIRAISAALVAKQTDKSDHKARLWAVDRYRDVLELAQGGKAPEIEAPKAPQLVTWEEFVVLYRSRKEAAHEDVEAVEQR